YIEETLAHHPTITAHIVAFFEARFNPGQMNVAAAQAARKAVGQALEQVTSLDEDRILRRLLNLAEAALRTNHWQYDADGRPKPYLSIKFDCAKVDQLPLPRPAYEIFVYSPRME